MLTCGQDRALLHINKKGRPVSQCPHCRGLRKARSSHVQCDCGAKPHSKEECVDNSEIGEVHSDPGSDLGSAASKTCCCTHGMSCTCALKKEHLDPVPEIDLAALPPKRSTSTSSKPRLLKAGSDQSMTVFTNGHHKPVHKHNDSAHKCGLPYKIPIPHSVPGNAEYARRSTDSLPLIRKREETQHSQLHESINSAKQELRQVRSAHGSPEPMASSFRANIGILPPLDLQYPYNDSHYSEEYSRSPGGLEGYYTSQEEQPTVSAGLSMPPMDWNDIDLASGALSATYSQPPSYASFEPSNLTRPGLTTSSSGEASEVDDYLSQGQGSLLRPDLPSTSSEDVTYNRLSSSSFTSLPHQTSALSSTNLDTLDYETFLKTTASPCEFEEPAAGGSDAFVRHGFTVHDAQKMAHPETPTEAMGGLSLPQHSDSTDSVWAHHFENEEGSFVSTKAGSEWD